MNYKHLSWDDIDQQCFDIYCQMCHDKYVPEVVIGLLRGGVVPARMFADYFGIKMDFYAMQASSYDGTKKSQELELKVNFDKQVVKGKKILVVDDIWDSGDTMRAVLAELQGEDVKVATLAWREINWHSHCISNREDPDYYKVTVKDEWVIFPWEKHEFLRHINKRQKV